MASFPISKFGQNLPVSGVVAFSQATVGLGIGLLVADKMGSTARQRTALALIGAGVAAVVPIAVGIYDRVSHRAASERDMRRRLNSLREDVGFAPGEEVA